MIGALCAGGGALAADGDDVGARDYGIDPVGATGKYVYRDGSKSKFLEDYNVQSGVDVVLGFEETVDDGTFRLQGFGQSGEKQGFVIGEYDQLGVFGLVLDFDHWTEYYNSRESNPRPGAFPFSSSSGVFNGNGVASTDWLTTGGAFDAQVGGFLHDVYGDFHYREVDGDQSLLKGGTIDGIADSGGLVPPSFLATGPVNFGISGRKDVDYDAYMASGGLRSGLLGINWQTDVEFQYHDIDSSTQEISYDTFQTGGTLAAADFFTEDTKLKVWKADIAGSHHVSHSLYIFGAGFFSYERSDPEPGQDVFETITNRALRTRWTTSSKIERYTPGGSLGLIWRPASRVVVRADTRVRGHIQEADLAENRDESQLVSFIGPQATLIHSADRDSVVETTTVSVDWKPTSRLTVKGKARYQYRLDDIDTEQRPTTAGAPREVEDYEQEAHRFKVGPTVRYRMRRGRAVEAGYQFSYADVEQDIDEILFQYNLGDYVQYRHRAFAKASGRIMDKLRGELRGQFNYEIRELDGANTVDALGNPESRATGGDDVEFWSWNVAPVLYWTPHQHWTIHGRYSIGQQKIEPDSGSTFDYEVLTQSATAGLTFRPSDKWSASGDYTFYHNNDDVENVGHNASISGEMRVTENLSVNGRVRYLGYEDDHAYNDDYDAVVVSLGLTGRF